MFHHLADIFFLRSHEPLVSIMKVKYQIGFRIDDVLEERRLINIDKD